ncbi:hypothetical protein AAFF_G00389120 [Aldrovandia affinis]|uniref:Uncharacterized protein n=1 Tax=Aldrovandia affinis TaxID=143900 RepID=A0AAD7SE68_9TELE|nr:hypothetical protein AAFF_G00389120 [Aldrovandia affinis]
MQSSPIGLFCQLNRRLVLSSWALPRRPVWLLQRAERSTTASTTSLQLGSREADDTLAGRGDRQMFRDTGVSVGTQNPFVILMLTQFEQWFTVRFMRCIITSSCRLSRALVAGALPLFQFPFLTASSEAQSLSR